MDENNTTDTNEAALKNVPGTQWDIYSHGVWFFKTNKTVLWKSPGNSSFPPAPCKQSGIFIQKQTGISLGHSCKDCHLEANISPDLPLTMF